MKKYIKQIFLVWRRGRSDRRIKIGKILKNKTDGIRFLYIQEGVNEAIKNGFNMYPDFPNPNVEYRNNVLEVFSQRLTNKDRADIQKYYDYWDISPQLKDDQYYVLAQTQGLLSTDNFEFLAEYYPVKDLKFTSEICGLSKTLIPSGTLNQGDVLQWKLEPNNLFDRYAVRLYKDNLFLGYVKAVHCKVFHVSKRKNLLVKIKSIEQNGHVNRAFISVLTESY